MRDKGRNLGAAQLRVTLQTIRGKRGKITVSHPDYWVIEIVAKLADHSVVIRTDWHETRVKADMHYEQILRAFGL